MKLGIKKIEHIGVEWLDDYSAVAPGSSIDITAYIKVGGSFSPLPFTVETGEFEESWNVDSRGRLSSVSFNASVRRDKETFRRELMNLSGRKSVWLLTLVSGKQYIIGSPEYVPLFTYSDGVSGISRSEFNISLRNDSLHGILLNNPVL